MVNKKLVLLCFALLGVVITSIIFFNGTSETATKTEVQVSLNPVDFGLPSTAKEVIEKRTPTSATFEITPGHFAAVSDGTPMFAYDNDGKLVEIGKTKPYDVGRRVDCQSAIPFWCSVKMLAAKVFPFALADSSGPNSPGTLSDTTGTGTVAWTNPSNASASDNVYATAGCSNINGCTINTHYLKTTNYGFSIASGSTINGVVVEIEKKCSANSGSTAYCRDAVVKLVQGGTISGNDKADTATNYGTSDAYVTYGSSSDLWGLTLTTTDTNVSTFGAVLSTQVKAAVTP